MACIIHIETATNVCSVAVSNEDELIFYKEDTDGPSHAKLLGVFVQEAITHLKIENLSPDAIAISSGPGSYTGLRIGVSEAKGVCYALNIPLIAIETLKIMAYRVNEESGLDSSTLLCPMVDARRMEVYDTIFDNTLNKKKETTADIVDENSFADVLNKQQIAFFGNGADKCKEVLTSTNAIFLENIYPRAKDMIALASEAYEAKNFVDVAYYEPFYLKEFVATVPKNKVLPQQN